MIIAEPRALRNAAQGTTADFVLDGSNNAFDCQTRLRWYSQISRDTHDHRELLARGSEVRVVCACRLVFFPLYGEKENEDVSPLVNLLSWCDSKRKAHSGNILSGGFFRLVYGLYHLPSSEYKKMLEDFNTRIPEYDISFAERLIYHVARLSNGRKLIRLSPHAVGMASAHVEVGDLCASSWDVLFQLYSVGKEITFGT
jgi:hypothetical protein